MRICPDCGEPCAQAWCGFCERMLPRRGCAFGECDDPQCYFCVVMPVKFATVPCPREVIVSGPKHPQRVRCRFVARHPGPCQPSKQRRVEDRGEASWWK